MARRDQWCTGEPITGTNTVPDKPTDKKRFAQ
jgi:hypothetical protein